MQNPGPAEAVWHSWPKAEPIYTVPTMSCVEGFRDRETNPANLVLIHMDGERLEDSIIEGLSFMPSLPVTSLVFQLMATALFFNTYYRSLSPEG